MLDWPKMNFPEIVWIDLKSSNFNLTWILQGGIKTILQASSATSQSQTLIYAFLYCLSGNIKIILNKIWK